MIDRVNVSEPIVGSFEGCIVALPGRGQSGLDITNYIEAMELDRTLIVAPTPRYREWYPAPNGTTDQVAALKGLPRAADSVDKFITSICKKYNVDRKKIVLNGFSAGGVMALWVAAHYEPVAAVYVNAGAILSPKDLPVCQCKDTKFLLQHNADDWCFEWEERYIPMKESLISQGYNAVFEERVQGGHRLTMEDVILGSHFAAPILGYKDFIHPRLAKESSDD